MVLATNGQRSRVLLNVLQDTEMLPTPTRNEAAPSVDSAKLVKPRSRLRRKTGLSSLVHITHWMSFPKRYAADPELTWKGRSTDPAPWQP